MRFLLLFLLAFPYSTISFFHPLPRHIAVANAPAPLASVVADDDVVCELDEESLMPVEEGCVERAVAELTLDEYLVDDNDDLLVPSKDQAKALKTLQAMLSAEAVELSIFDDYDEDEEDTEDEERWQQEQFLATCHEDELTTLTQPGLGNKASHTFVEKDCNDGLPVRIDEQFIFVDEANCIGCGLCAAIAPDSFLMEKERGRGRAFQQGVAPREVMDEVRSACPTRCIHPVSWTELVDFETARDDGTSDTSPGGRQRPVTGSEFPWQSKGSALESVSCYGSTECPKRGCFNCPMYTQVGGNPNYIASQAEILERRKHYGGLRNDTASYRACL